MPLHQKKNTVFSPFARTRWQRHSSEFASCIYIVYLWLCLDVCFCDGEPAASSLDLIEPHRISEKPRATPMMTFLSSCRHRHQDQLRWKKDSSFSVLLTYAFPSAISIPHMRKSSHLTGCLNQGGHAWESHGGMEDSQPHVVRWEWAKDPERYMRLYVAKGMLRVVRTKLFHEMVNVVSFTWKTRWKTE